MFWFPLLFCVPPEFVLCFMFCLICPFEKLFGQKKKSKLCRDIC